MNIELKFADGLMRFVNSFNITVDAISRLLPDQRQFAETVLYDLRSFAESMDSKKQLVSVRSLLIMSFSSRPHIILELTHYFYSISMHS